MFKKNQAFNFGFAILFLAQLITEANSLIYLNLPAHLNFIIKPLITLSLFGLLLVNTGLRGRFSKRIGIGLLFGLFGDVFLLFDHLDPSFFTLGLISFLIGHISYMSAFYLDYSLNKTAYKAHTKNAILGYSFFGILFCGVLWTHLGDMKIPVIIYALGICAMGVMAVNRYGRVNSLSYKLIFLGSVMFILSDSVLAIDRFVYTFKGVGIIVMATYMAAQYLIVMGNLERKLKKKVEEI